MSLRTEVETDPRAAVFSLLDEVRAGMLGLSGQNPVLQPMTHFADPETGLIWFITAKDTALVRDLAATGAAQAVYAVVSLNHDAHASLRGPLDLVQDGERLDNLWSPLAAAWFAEGGADPRVTLLRFAPVDGQIWVSHGAGLGFGVQNVLANLSTEQTPDLGSHAMIAF